jgi:hypothetical protein
VARAFSTDGHAIPIPATNVTKPAIMRPEEVKLRLRKIRDTLLLTLCRYRRALYRKSGACARC